MNAATNGRPILKAKESLTRPLMKRADAVHTTHSTRTDDSALTLRILNRLARWQRLRDAVCWASFGVHGDSEKKDENKLK